MTPVLNACGCSGGCHRRRMPVLLFSFLLVGAAGLHRPHEPLAPLQPPAPPPPPGASNGRHLFIGTHSQTFDFVPQSQCGRCTSPDSSLIVLESQAVYGWEDGAGLTDRSLMIASVGNLAASLCARVQVRPPCWMLGAMHNQKQKLNCTIGWDRYLRLLSISDGSDMLVPEGSDATWADRDVSTRLIPINNLTVKAKKDFYGRFMRQLLRTPFPMMKKAAARLWSEYEEARALVSRGERIVWYINYNFYWWRDEVVSRFGAKGAPEAMQQEGPGSTVSNGSAMHGSLALGSSSPTHDLLPVRAEAAPWLGKLTSNRTCCYVSIMHSASTLTVVDRARAMLEARGGMLSEMLALHIRRGDAKAYCNTSASWIRKQVMGKISHAGVGGEAIHSSRPRIIYFTDERSQDYLHELSVELESLFGGAAGNIIHGDALVLEASTNPILREDNFHRYAVQSALYSEAGQQLRVGFHGLCAHIDRSGKAGKTYITT